MAYKKWRLQSVRRGRLSRSILYELYGGLYCASIAILGDTFYSRAIDYYIMSRTIELSDELAERLEGHLEGDETIEEFIEELVGIYEQEERFSDPGL